MPPLRKIFEKGFFAQRTKREKSFRKRNTFTNRIKEQLLLISWLAALSYPADSIYTSFRYYGKSLIPNQEYTRLFLFASQGLSTVYVSEYETKALCFHSCCSAQ